MTSRHNNHDHHHGHHHHAPIVHANNARATGLAALLTGGFMLAEIVGGLLSGSLALLADAAHMVTDFAALGLAYIGFFLARKPAAGRATFGLGRFGILAAFVNGLALFVMAGWIVVEAAMRLSHAPAPIEGGVMLTIAIGGLGINLLCFWLLSQADRDNLNIRGALGHILGDLLGSIAAIIAAGVIMTIGWTPIDALLSILVALLVLRSAWSVTRDSMHILLEVTPAGIDPIHIRQCMIDQIDGLSDLHHLHIWSLTQERPMATLHAVISQNADAGHVRQMIRHWLQTHHHIGHVTIEVEQDGEACLHPAGH